MTRQRIGGQALGGATRARESRPGGAIVVPLYDAAYYLSSTGRGFPLGGAAIGGRRQLVRPAAGILALPDPAAGTVTLQWWWAYAQACTIVRVARDGTRTPVRGGEGVTPTGPSRINPQTNPRARDSLTGYSAGPNTTLSRQADLTPGPVAGVTTAVRGTATVAGAALIVAPNDAVSASPSVYGFEVQTSAVTTALGVSVEWFDVNSASIGASTYSVGRDDRQRAAAGLTWVTVAVNSIPAQAAVGVLSYRAAGLQGGGWFQITARITAPSTSLRRVNLVPNSSLEVDATGWSNGYVRAGVTATEPATATTVTAAHGSRYGWINMTSPAGTTSTNTDVVVRGSTMPVDPALTYRAAVSLNCSGADIGYGRLGVDWLDAAGAPLSSGGSVTTAALVLPASGWLEFSLDVTPPAAAVQARIALWFTNTENSTTVRSFRFDAAVLEDRNTYLAGGGSFVESVSGSLEPVGPELYFDGDSLGAAYIGADGVSYSQIGQLQTLVDAEAPLDAAVAYEMTASSVPGWFVRSEAVRIDGSAAFGSAGRWGSRRRALLTHPGQARTVRLWIQDAPELEDDIAEGRHRVKGRRNIVVVQAAQRDGWTSSLDIWCETGDELDRLLDMLAVPSPMLLRLSGDLVGYPPNWWQTWGKVRLAPLERSGRIPMRKLTVPVTTVDRPTVAGAIAV